MAKQSLAAQGGVLSKANVQLPAIFGSSSAVVSRYIPPYITFAHPKRNDEWKRILEVNKAAQDGDMYLIRQKDVVRLDQAKMSMFCCKQYWALKDGVGNLQKASFEEQPYPYKEHIEAVVLLFLPNNEIVPANIQFRTTKCPAGKALADALELASTPEWAEKSKAHAETMQANLPVFRFYGLVEVGPNRTSKSSGNVYRPTTCEIQPTGPNEWLAIAKFSADEGAQKLIQDAADTYEYRLKSVAEKA